MLRLLFRTDNSIGEYQWQYREMQLVCTLILLTDGARYPIRASKVDGFRTKSYCVYSYKQYDLVRKPSILDALIGYFTPSHVIHQRLLLQFLSAPENGGKKRPKHVEYYCSY